MISCRCGATLAWSCRAFLHRDDVLLRLLAQGAVVLVGDGFEQRTMPEVSSSSRKSAAVKHRHCLATALVEVGGMRIRSRVSCASVAMDLLFEQARRCGA